MVLPRRNFIQGTLCAAAAVGAQVVRSEDDVPTDTTMKVRFLGSGSACWERVPRDSKIFRRYSSILVDRTFLVDYTWMTEEMMPKDVHPKAILYTHSHPDHYDPKAAVKLGVRDVYLQKGWIDEARRDFEKAVQKLGGMMPTLHPVDVCEKFRMGNYEILPLPGNHNTGKIHEQALIYKISKVCTDGPVRLLYATDTSGLMAKVFYYGFTQKEPITAVIMEATGNPGRRFDGLRINHSTADMVHDIFSTYLKPGKGRYMPPPGQPVYLTHIGCYEWGQKTFDDVLPKGLLVAHDGLEVEFRP